MDLRGAFEAWSRGLLEEDFLRAVGERLRLDAAGSTAFVKQSVEEAALTLELASPHLDRGKRSLEVGAGAGVLSSFLILGGFDHVAVDPGGEFGANEAFFTLLAERRNVDASRVVRRPVEQLEPSQVGRFDFIFSNNVLEHVADFEQCLGRLSVLLSDGGRMLHNCPNYDVPYEPHYGIPLVPFFPARTGDLVPRLRGEGCWQSLNFVTYRRVQRSARRLGRTASFRRATMFDAFARMLQTESFAARHATLGLVARTLERTGLLRMMKLVPPSLATPMVFEIR